MLYVKNVVRKGSNCGRATGNVTMNYFVASKQVEKGKSTFSKTYQMQHIQPTSLTLIMTREAKILKKI